MTKEPHADEYKIDVLDHGYVRLADYMGGDLSIVRAARVSYDADWRAGESAKSDEHLIGYLMRNGHTSPFEAATLTFEVMAPIFVLRQWQRHRTQSYNEVSARYTELPNVFYAPEITQVTRQSTDNKQGRTGNVLLNAAELRDCIIAQNEMAFGLYHTLLASGLSRELARTVLPLGTYSRMFTTVNLHNLFRFLGLRTHEHAQYEIRVYAEAMVGLAAKVAPIATREWLKTLDVGE